MLANRYPYASLVQPALLAIAVFGCTLQGYAQLNENCTVAILNRTAQVKPDGTWKIDNIPANFGPVRARATCVQGGVTLSGQSDLFIIGPNAVTGFNANIILGPVTPIPTQLAVTATPLTLTQPNQAVQMSVIGTYANGSTSNLTNASTGTQYRVSNPALATISANGLLTALKSGTVLVQATNEGTQGLLQLGIALTGDTDGDGIPDDIEIANGLNPNDPSDALDDADRDGLNNREEVARGTLMRNPDTDGDTLTDGREVNVLRTNPLLADSDGDGVPDNVEVATGSDANNPASFNLAQALKGITVAPANFAINVNSVLGIGYQQLLVTGEFNLGGFINLTSKSRGTTYLSSNLQICNFGAEDGRVFGSADGSCTITVGNSGFVAAASGVVQNFTPTALSFLSIPGFANNVDVNGNFAYVASGFTGLRVVGVSDPKNPQIVGAVDTPGNANDVVVVGNTAYVADGSSGLVLINIVNPLAPSILGTLDTPGDASDLIVDGTTVYVADGTGGLRIINVSNPLAPQSQGSLALPGIAKGVDVDPVRQIAVVAAGTAGLHVVSVANKANPTLLATLPGGDVRDVVLKGNYAFLADFSRSFTVVDLVAPASPILRTSTPSNLGGLLMDVTSVGQFAAGADVVFVNGVPLIEVSSPLNPIPRAIIDFRSFRDDNGTGIAMDGSYVYLTAQRGLGTDNGVSEDTRLYIGQYLAVSDLAGIPPVVSIVSPTQGGTVIQGSTLPITINATDDISVAAVKFLVNGQLVFTDTSAPYQFNYAVPLGATTLTLGAQAIDLGGNVGNAPNVVVTAIPDPLTTVTGRVEDITAVPVAGATVTALTTFSSLTVANGTFSIPNVPTVLGNISVRAVRLQSGVQIQGTSGSFAPVLGGTTNVGTIVARSGRKIAVYGAPGNTTWNTDVQTKLQSTGLFTQVDAFMVSGGSPIPTLAELQQYDAVFVYSDAGFNSATQLGNVLADYLDSGGGVVMATFAFYSGGGLGIQGRITAGYLPFTLASQNQPGNLTLVPIMTSHPILNGVTSFHGGSSSYHNSSITTTAGSTLVANWSNGQPLVATKQLTTGRMAGLNFYPPSSTARGDFWQSNTNGALLMGNALIWAAR